MNNQTKHFYIQLKIFQFFNLIMKVIKQLAILGVYVVKMVGLSLISHLQILK